MCLGFGYGLCFWWQHSHPWIGPYPLQEIKKCRKQLFNSVLNFHTSVQSSEALVALCVLVIDDLD